MNLAIAFPNIVEIRLKHVKKIVHQNHCFGFARFPLKQQRLWLCCGTGNIADSHNHQGVRCSPSSETIRNRVTPSASIGLACHLLKQIHHRTTSHSRQSFPGFSSCCVWRRCPTPREILDGSSIAVYWKLHLSFNKCVDLVSLSIPAFLNSSIKRSCSPFRHAVTNSSGSAWAASIVPPSFWWQLGTNQPPMMEPDHDAPQVCQRQCHPRRRTAGG